MTDIMSNMLKYPKFKELKHSFLINIAADNTQLISLNSDNLEVRIYKKSDGKMIELLAITGKSNSCSSRIDVTSNEKVCKFSI